MKSKLILTLTAISALTGQLFAVSPSDLQVLIERGEKVTVVDIRTTGEFKTGHIPGAINVPEEIISAKKLPPLGKVIVCGSGLGTDKPEVAAAALSQKRGIQAEVLEGGFAAWDSLNAPSTRQSGLTAESTKHITYDQLKNAQAGDVVLVDLRKKDAKSLAKTGPKTDLKSAFPKAGQVSSSLEAVTPKNGGSRLSKTIPPLLVLIDDGDGESYEAARRLRAEGHKRVVVLVGGEKSLEREGKPGLQRSGYSREATQPELK